MKYTVILSKVAEDSLAEIWLRCDDRKAVSLAANRIEKQLALDPLSKVIWIDNFAFIGHGDLGALCVVDEANRIVTIVDYRFRES